MSSFRITQGFTEAERSIVAALFWEAFGAKLSVGLGPEAKALKFLARVADPQFAPCARDANGTPLGFAGFKTSEGALIGDGFGNQRAVFGTLGAICRAALLSLLERYLKSETLLMDGIFVTQNARGMGLGSALLQAIEAEANQQNCRDVRLDVIDNNPRAHELYKREGFVVGKVQTLGPLKHFFGFSSATEMCFTLHSHS